MKSILKMERITKSYKGVPAIKEVDFDLCQGEIHALLGENGAGKSTLTKIMAGAVEASAGKMIFHGRTVSFSSPHEALNAGITMVFQETSLVPSMTVAQNLYLGSENFLNRLRGIFISAQQFLQSLDFSVDPTAMVETLGAAKQQMVEIARAVQHNVEVIIFDEPTASLTPEEKRHFFALLQRLKGDGVSIIFISHALEEALEISDRITILRDGELVATDDTTQFNRDKIISAMVGRTLSKKLYRDHRETEARKPGKKVLSIQDISKGNVVRNNSFSVFEGQITGVFGLIGSGRTETFKIISGIDKRDFLRGGTIELNDKPVRYYTPHEAIGDGIVYVTENRKTEGLFETMTIGENIFAGFLSAGRNKSWITRFKDIQKLVGQWIKDLNIKTINENALVVELSGGNQQKTMIAKGLTQEPGIIIFDEPTRGVDVGNIGEIHQLINKLADKGIAVVVISSHLPEIMSLADRILVCRQGRIVEELSPAETTEEEIMYAAVH
jgi:simple sugar transport system ATP-binding protein